MQNANVCYDGTIVNHRLAGRTISSGPCPSLRPGTSARRGNAPAGQKRAPGWVGVGFRIVRFPGSGSRRGLTNGIRKRHDLHSGVPFAFGEARRPVKGPGRKGECARGIGGSCQKRALPLDRFSWYDGSTRSERGVKWVMTAALIMTILGFVFLILGERKRERREHARKGGSGR